MEMPHFNKPEPVGLICNRREAEMDAGVIKEGASAPLGATECDGGVNFSVFSRSATLVELLLFDDENAAKPAKVIPLDPNRHRTYHYWHVFVPDLQPGPEAESGQVAWDLMRLAWSSVAALAIAPLQDLLNLGPEARMNVPGRAEGNWAWRCTEEMLSGPALHFLLELTTNSNRLCPLRSPLTSGIPEAAS